MVVSLHEFVLHKPLAVPAHRMFGKKWFPGRSDTFYKFQVGKNQAAKGGFTVRTADIFIITINGCFFITFWIFFVCIPFW